MRTMSLLRVGANLTPHVGTVSFGHLRLPSSRAILGVGTGAPAVSPNRVGQVYPKSARRFWAVILALPLSVALYSCGPPLPQDSLRGVDLGTKDQACVRQCSQTYSFCAQRASSSNLEAVHDLLEACGGALRICVDACGVRRR